MHLHLWRHRCAKDGVACLECLALLQGVPSCGMQLLYSCAIVCFSRGTCILVSVYTQLVILQGRPKLQCLGAARQLRAASYKQCWLSLSVFTIKRTFFQSYNPYRRVSADAGAMKVVAEAFPWSEHSTFAYTLDNHNSVVGMRGYALWQQASAMAVHIMPRGLNGVAPLNRWTFSLYSSHSGLIPLALLCLTSCQPSVAARTSHTVSFHDASAESDDTP